jgi:tRNA (guanine-N7-)-methyltransferase
MGSENDSPAAARRGAVLFGRRRGPRLRPARRQLLDELLPSLSIEIPADGIVARPLEWFPPGARDDLWLEIGFGGGEHLLAQAIANPRVALIGCEPFINGVARVLSGLVAAGLSAPASCNVRLYPDDGRNLVAALPDASVGRVFILFPDPWPKARHHKRRLVTSALLDQLSRVMKDGAELRLATDHRPYCRWILACLLPHRGFAWMENGPAEWQKRPSDWSETRYERKAQDAGRDCIYLRFRRRARSTCSLNAAVP